MASPNSPNPDALRFFTLEASDCLERLDASLNSAGPAGPAHDDFVAAARMLRGSATMHRMPGMTELAQSVEQAARALRDGTARWSPAFAAAMIAAVDDLKLLLHAVRHWGPQESARVAARVTELAHYIPDSAHAMDRTPAAATTPDFIARTVRDIANTLSAVATRAHQDDVVEEALAKVRSVRGIAALVDVPAANEILEGVEKAARSSNPQARAAVFRAAGEALRRTEPNAPELTAFRSTYRQYASDSTDADHIVPVSELGFGDPSRDVVHAAPAPPTTRAERFRLEVVSQAEHLLLLVSEARDANHAHGQSLSPTLTEELNAAIRGVQSVATSFGERDIADLLGTFADGTNTFDFLKLNAIHDIAQILADPHTPDLSKLTRARAADAEIGLAFATPQADAPVVIEPAETTLPPAPPVAEPEVRAAKPEIAQPEPAKPAPEIPRAAPSHRTPTGPALQALLADSLSGLQRLADDEDSLFTVPTTPVPVSKDSAPDEVVPIEVLLYRGPAALAQARTLRGMIIPGTPPSMDVVNEILDLIDLAASAS